MEHWIKIIAKQLAKKKEWSGLIVAFPEYRPDLLKTLANELNYSFYDYREAEMAPLGMKAAELTLAELDRTLYKTIQAGPTVLHNIESLLLSKQNQSVITWLTEFSTKPWGHNVVLPVVILADVALNLQPDAVVDLTQTTFPEQSLISRLMH
ncbi:MAG: hypothetical protein JBO36_06855 [Candidatus Thiodiazotropha taylori]|nr:hypothetical protein [Candidatus Thiodiazotropha taylori]